MNLLQIDENTKPSWETKDNRFFVIEKIAEPKIILAAVYKVNPFRNDGYVIYIDSQPVYHTYSLEQASFRLDLVLTVDRHFK